ncbi:hypothetical protein SRA_08291 [Streptococcus ratti FA-1 = DSM 20564]|uniref:Uncharacterized protein n=1 Tax=Streptococcus ratti FA-1 = DSM 20564 TaxID=699248 RepID=A0ABN0GW08_STRRT|nr:hypothetical protein SRA_08291 [Streptococcus ratti FA-1 = DSM 20564]
MIKLYRRNLKETLNQNFYFIKTNKMPLWGLLAKRTKIGDFFQPFGSCQSELIIGKKA